MLFLLFAPRFQLACGLSMHCANFYLKTAVWAIIKLDVLMSPNLFESLDCLAARLGITLFQLVDRSLGETNSSRKLGLTPTEHGTSRPDFGCESALSAFINLAAERHLYPISYCTR